MAEVTKEQYEYALERIEELLPYVGNDVPMNDKHMIEMDIVSDIVNRYEKIHYPIAKPTLGELIADSLDTMGLSAKNLRSNSTSVPHVSVLIFTANQSRL